jgi:hypothetical protein
MAGVDTILRLNLDLIHGLVGSIPTLAAENPVGGEIAVRRTI